MNTAESPFKCEGIIIIITGESVVQFFFQMFIVNKNSSHETFTGCSLHTSIQVAVSILLYLSVSHIVGYSLF